MTGHAADVNDKLSLLVAQLCPIVIWVCVDTPVNLGRQMLNSQATRCTVTPSFLLPMDEFRSFWVLPTSKLPWQTMSVVCPTLHCCHSGTCEHSGQFGQAKMMIGGSHTLCI